MLITGKLKVLIREQEPTFWTKELIFQNKSDIVIYALGKFLEVDQEFQLV